MRRPLTWNLMFEVKHCRGILKPKLQCLVLITYLDQGNAYPIAVIIKLFHLLKKVKKKSLMTFCSVNEAS